MPGELERGLGLRIGQTRPTPSPWSVGDLALAAGPRRDLEPRVESARALGGEPGGQRVADGDDQDAGPVEPDPLEDLGVRGVAEHGRGPEPLDRLEPPRVAIDDDAAEPAGARGRDDDPPDPAGAQDDDRRAGGPPRRR